MRVNIWLGCEIGVISAVLVGLAGCTKNDDPAKPQPGVQIEAKKDNHGKIIPGQAVALHKGSQLLRFKDAVLLDPPSEDEIRPPNKTSTGKNAIKIFETIANGMWDQVVFADNEGRRIKYQAIMATDAGDLQIDLFGDIAPNHVRSFVCLAKTGYFDGMPFYYSIKRKITDDTVAYIESGCPRGTGEFGSGSIGYWLRPEFSESLSHEEGMIGACQGSHPESAACRFYITAAPMPWMDGRFTLFGKVTKGLDIVRTINTRSVNEFDRPEQPVVIRGVTIRAVTE